MSYLFSALPLKLSLFLRLRWYLTPYSEMAKNIKSSGLFFDIGCGHGLLSFLLASRGERKILACDHDRGRIQIAKISTALFSNIEYYQGSFQVVVKDLKIQNKFDGIFLIDVLHYLNSGEQEALLIKIKESLADDGVFVMREVHPKVGIISKINRFYEWLATHSGFTKTNNLVNTFKTPEEWRQLLLRCGFTTVDIRKCSFWLFADYLFEAKITSENWK